MKFVKPLDNSIFTESERKSKLKDERLLFQSDMLILIKNIGEL